MAIKHSPGCRCCLQPSSSSSSSIGCLCIDTDFSYRRESVSSSVMTNGNPYIKTEIEFSQDTFGGTHRTLFGDFSKLEFTSLTGFNGTYMHQVLTEDRCFSDADTIKTQSWSLSVSYSAAWNGVPYALDPLPTIELVSTFTFGGLGGIGGADFLGKVELEIRVNQGDDVSLLVISKESLECVKDFDPTLTVLNIGGSFPFLPGGTVDKSASLQTIEGARRTGGITSVQETIGTMKSSLIWVP